MDPPSMHAKLLDVNVMSTLHGTQFDVDPMGLEANLVSGQFSKLIVVNGNMDSSNKGNSVMPLHENSPSSAKEDVVVPHSLVSNALVVSSDPVALAIFSDSVSLTTSHEQQSRSVNEISIVPGSSAVVPVNDSSVDIRSDLMLTSQVSSFPRSETILESSTISGLISDVCSTAPIQTVPTINSLVQTVSTTMGPSQRPPIPYTTHMVRKDCYGFSQIPSSVADDIHDAVFAMDAASAPGPDGFSGGFY
ncbi:hypothetical protein Q3G72_032876 [Acer saccharum]|nr:hypothetical protein Q3G72_032876 [Acer saccharum]